MNEVTTDDKLALRLLGPTPSCSWWRRGLGFDIVIINKFLDSDILMNQVKKRHIRIKNVTHVV